MDREREWMGEERRGKRGGEGEEGRGWLCCGNYSVGKRGR